jgi:hypothetical protein
VTYTEKRVDFFSQINRFAHNQPSIEMASDEPPESETNGAADRKARQSQLRPGGWHPEAAERFVG